MPKLLTKKKIELRFVEWRNLKRLYPIARRRIVLLEKENKELKTRIQTMEREHSQTVAKLLLRIEELGKMVFGQKGDRHSNPDKFNFNRENRDPSKQNRLPASFRRPIPSKDQITSTRHYRLKAHICPDCGANLENIKQTEQFKEDIIIQKTVVRQFVETGYCRHCRKQISTIPLANQAAYLGQNIRRLVCFADTVLRSSYEQIKELLNAAGLQISDGEISAILEQQAQKLLPGAGKISEIIGKETGSHYDETSWKVSGADGWAWVRAAVKTNLAIFSLGQSRGGGNINELGIKPKVGISDDYPPYKNAFAFHQLCWAHPLRKLKDLAMSEVLKPRQRKLCFAAWKELTRIHGKLKRAIAKPFDQKQRLAAKARLAKKFAQAAQPCARDPGKLAAIKERLVKTQNDYFTCLDFEGIPTTNNKAERSLRHLVIKRRICFGSKSVRGAHTAGILNTVMLSLKWLKPKNYFTEFGKLLAGDFSFLEAAAS